MLRHKGLIDFPWDFSQRSPHAETKFGIGAGGYYQTIPDPVAMAVFAPWINTLYARDAVCFFWAVNSKLDFCIDFIKACGFEYSTVGFVWVKTYADGSFVRNPGFFKAANTELLLIGKRGSLGEPWEKMMCEIVETQEDIWVPPDFPFPIEIRHPRLTDESGKVIHSAKPEIFRELIDKLYPAWVFGKGLELFARHKPSPDWLYFGNEIESDIEGPGWDQEKKIWVPASGSQMKLNLGGHC